MTTFVAKKRTHGAKVATIRGRVPRGVEVRRDSRGRVNMIEFSEYKRDPNAPERLVNKIGGIYRFGGIIKCTFVLEAPGPAGVVEAVERASLLWEPHSIYSANEQFSWAFSQMLQGNILPDDGGGRRARTQ